MIVPIQGHGKTADSPANWFGELVEALSAAVPDQPIVRRAWNDSRMLPSPLLGTDVLLIPFSHGIEYADLICSLHVGLDVRFHIAAADIVQRKHFANPLRPAYAPRSNVISLRSWRRVCGPIPPFSTSIRMDRIPDNDPEKARTILNFPVFWWTSHVGVVKKAIPGIVAYAKTIFRTKAVTP